MLVIWCEMRDVEFAVPRGHAVRYLAHADVHGGDHAEIRALGGVVGQVVEDVDQAGDRERGADAVLGLGCVRGLAVELDDQTAHGSSHRTIAQDHLSERVAGNVVVSKDQVGLDGLECGIHQHGLSSRSSFFSWLKQYID